MGVGGGEAEGKMEEQEDEGGRRKRSDVLIVYEGEATRSHGAADGATFIQSETVMLAVSYCVTIFGHLGCPDPPRPLRRPSTHI